MNIHCQKLKAGANLRYLTGCSVGWPHLFLMRCRAQCVCVCLSDVRRYWSTCHSFCPHGDEEQSPWISDKVTMVMLLFWTIWGHQHELSTELKLGGFCLDSCLPPAGTTTTLIEAAAHVHTNCFTKSEWVTQERKTVLWPTVKPPELGMGQSAVLSFEMNQSGFSCLSCLPCLA